MIKYFYFALKFILFVFQLLDLIKLFYIIIIKYLYLFSNVSYYIKNLIKLRGGGVRISDFEKEENLVSHHYLFWKY